MKQSYMYITAGVVVLLVGLLGYNALSNKETQAPREPVVEDKQPDKRPEVTITAKRQFKDGVHTFAGETDLPTPCHILDQSIIVAESFPEQVTVGFTSETQADSCVQVITPARFKFDVQVSENASFEATLNGVPVVFNIIEAGPDEDLDDFELFIKG